MLQMTSTVPRGRTSARTALRSDGLRSAATLLNSRGRLHRVILCGLLCCATLGCNKLPFFAGSEASADSELAEFEDEPAATGSHQVAATTVSHQQETTADLALKLELGQRFPLIKTVEQRLTQPLAVGQLIGYSKLEALLSLVVEEVRGPQRKLAVKYHRIRFAQEIGGEKVEFSTDHPHAQIPVEALAYAGLKVNGFSFWLGPDNQVGELVGFQDFVERCVRHVPAEQRSAVIRQLQAMRSEDGLANFVDDSIGLLPNPADPQVNGQPLRIGSGWELRPKAQATGAANATTQCKLTELTPQTAEILLFGSIGPSTYTDDVRRITLEIQGGQCRGSCVVDRRTGMPTRSRIERILDMKAHLPDGSVVEQKKEIITTVLAFLDQSTARPTAQSASVGAPASVVAQSSPVER